MEWACGVTTVPSRGDGLLRRTLTSLAAGGFKQPRLFVDGARHAGDEHWWNGSEVTCRWPAVKAWGNWILALHELHIRQPNADRYAIFQDDMVCSRNLRTYLEHSPYPGMEKWDHRAKGYLNLFTFLSSESSIQGTALGTWSEGSVLSDGKDPFKRQCGRGAVALVFSRMAVRTLLGSKEAVERVADAARGSCNIDGGVVNAMNAAGWREYVHNPSLVQHTGDVSTMGHGRYPLAESFRGEDFDCLSLLPMGWEKPKSVSLS